MYVTNIAINKNGTIIATAGRDGIVRIFKYDYISLQIEKYDQIDIMKLIKSENSNNNNNDTTPIEIERILFCENSDKTSKYLSICNGTETCYIYNIETLTVTNELFDRYNRNKYYFRECCFLLDNNYYNSRIYGKNCNNIEYCVIAVNEKRSRKNTDPYSYLYQYMINDEFNQCAKQKIIKATIKRMICDKNTNCIITLHTNGTICVTNGLNLQKLNYIENKGAFFMDIALQPLTIEKINQWKKNRMSKDKRIRKKYQNIDIEQRYLIIAMSNSVILRKIKLPFCSLARSGNSIICCGCCTSKLLTSFCTVFVVFIAMFFGIVLDPKQKASFNSIFSHFN